MRELRDVLVSAGVAALISVVCCKISAVYTFEVIDGYVKNLIKTAKRAIGEELLKNKGSEKMMTKITVTIKVNSMEEVEEILKEIEKLESRFSVIFNIEVEKVS